MSKMITITCQRDTNISFQGRIDPDNTFAANNSKDNNWVINGVIDNGTVKGTSQIENLNLIGEINVSSSFWLNDLNNNMELYIAEIRED